jgi:hypothetical protein
MKESTIKKEFSRSTVQRMRNLLTGKSGDRTQVQAGYEKQVKDHEEGDVWEENGKNWTIKNGIKMSITKLDDIKKLAILPITCPCCKKPFKDFELNRKMYRLHDKCLDCVTEEQTKMKIDGTWDKYVQDMQRAERDHALEDFEKALDAWVESSDTFVTESGDVEDWGNVDKTVAYEKIKSEIKKMRQTDI